MKILRQKIYNRCQDFILDTKIQAMLNITLLLHLSSKTPKDISREGPFPAKEP